MEKLTNDITCVQTLSKTISVEIDSSADLENIYHNTDHYTPNQLIQLFGKFLRTAVKNKCFFKSKEYTKKLIEECSGWYEDETTYVKG